MRREEVEELFRDALREIMSIAVGKAANSMTEFVGKLTTMKVSKISLISVSEIMRLIKDPEEILAVLVFKLRGDIDGYLLLMSEEKEIKKIAKIAIQKNLGEIPYDKSFEESAIREIGNIFCSNFCNAISSFIGYTIRSDPGDYILDMAGAVLDSLAPIFEEMDIIYAIRTQVRVEEEKIKLEILYLPDEKTLEKISKVVSGVV